MRHIAYLASVSLGTLVVLGCANEDTPSSPGSTVLRVCEASRTAEAPLRLMTREEYNNTVFDLLGVQGQPAADFPPENQVAGFNNNSQLHQVNRLLVKSYQRAAGEIVENLDWKYLERYQPCAQESADASACSAPFIDRFGLAAFRRPLTSEERGALVQLFDTTAKDGGVAAATLAVVEATLQSPQFLYRVDSSPVAPGSQVEVTPGAAQLGPYEMASRLSYFLLDSMPDETLLAAAQHNELETPEQIEAQARRLLQDPRAQAMVVDFHRQWLTFDRFKGLVRKSSANETLSAELERDLRKSLELFIQDAYRPGGSLEDLMTSNVVYVNDRLAKILDIAPPAGSDFGRVELPAEQRVGLLTQPGMMALLAHPDQSSPIKRGVFVREHILCDEIAPPPPGADQMPPDPDPSLTTRQRFAVHTESPPCAVCHIKIDGIGFGFERYDQLGRYRVDEGGLPIDDSGDLAEVDESNISGTFNGAQQLARRLAKSKQVQQCVATQWYRYAMGRIERAEDECAVSQVQRAFARSGGKFEELLVAITLSDAFRYRGLHEGDQP